MLFNTVFPTFPKELQKYQQTCGKIAAKPPSLVVTYIKYTINTNQFGTFKRKYKLVVSLVKEALKM